MTNVTLSTFFALQKRARGFFSSEMHRSPMTMAGSVFKKVIDSSPVTHSIRLESCFPRTLDWSATCIQYTMKKDITPLSSEAMSLIQQMSIQLDTGLNQATLAAVVNLLELGFSPEAIVATVSELQRRRSR
jgi:hypothetical protein